MHLLFVFEEHSDVADATVVRRQADSIMDALHNPTLPRPYGEWVGGEIAKQCVSKLRIITYQFKYFCRFWKNAMVFSSSTFQRRFVNASQEYTDSVVQQALDRDHYIIRNIDQYFEIRRGTVGVMPVLAVCLIHFDIPDEAMSHPGIVALESACVDMILICNDLLSYNVEWVLMHHWFWSTKYLYRQARGDDEHNLITVVMRERKCSLASAVEWIVNLHDNIVNTFLSTIKTIPSFGDPIVDEKISIYIDGLGTWVRANEAWSFEVGLRSIRWKTDADVRDHQSARYFGRKGLKIKESRIIDLLPKHNTGPPLRTCGD